LAFTNCTAASVTNASPVTIKRIGMKGNFFLPAKPAKLCLSESATSGVGFAVSSSRGWVVSSPKTSGVEVNVGVGLGVGLFVEMGVGDFVGVIVGAVVGF